MLRDNAGWLLAGLIAAAVLFSATACSGGRTDNAGGIAFWQPTIAPWSPPPEATQPTAAAAIPTEEVRKLSSSRPCWSEPWFTVKDTVICLPPDVSLSLMITECPPIITSGGPQLPCPAELQFHVIRRGDSEVRIGTESGKIVRWDVAPEDEEYFRHFLAPLQQVSP